MHLKPGTLLSIFIILLSCNQKMDKSFPEGFTIDPEIEQICQQKKDSINSFTIQYFEDDSLAKNLFKSVADNFPIIPMVNLTASDTSLNFINMLTNSGFTIAFSKSGSEVSYSQSSRSCKCFKDSLTQKEPLYGGSATPQKLTLVLNKRHGLKQGDEIYGYIDFSGGSFYRLISEEKKEYKKISASCRGYFRVEMKDIKNALEDIFKKKG